MASEEYRVRIIGCDDETVVWLSPALYEQYKGFFYLVNLCSSGTCSPTIQVSLGGGVVLQKKDEDDA